MRNNRNLNRKVKEKFAIVVDGETEIAYFNMLKRNEKLITIDIEPKLPQSKKLKEQYIEVDRLAKDYDRVYWVVDLDDIQLKSKVGNKGKQKVLDEFIKYKNDIEKYSSNVIVIINQPCLEYWFLLHFIFTTKIFSNCDSVGKELKKHLPDYNKNIKNYFIKQSNDIYFKLKPYLKTAIENSKKLSEFNENNSFNSISQMYRIFEDLKIIV